MLPYNLFTYIIMYLGERKVWILPSILNLHASSVRNVQVLEKVLNAPDIYYIIIFLSYKIFWMLYSKVRYGVWRLLFLDCIETAYHWYLLI